MKAQEFFVQKHGPEEIRVELDELPRFYPLLHYHEEVQITLVKQGRGILFAGAGFVQFNPGDIYILGSNLPHVFKSSQEVKKVIGISVYFSPQFGGSQFWNMEETKNMGSLINQSRSGIKLLDDNSQQDFKVAIESLQNASPSGKLIIMLTLLDELVGAEKKIISAVDFLNPSPGQQTRRMDNVISFISSNYHRPISLPEISSKAHLTQEAFCRFFKRNTRKTFTRYINEVRISHAIRLILESDLSISEIAYQCGFRNLSNFNRQFLKISGKNPGELRRLQINKPSRW